ncbi:MAG: hypothetical protein ACPKOI_11335 [Pleomorphochaeta sp.]
MNYLKAKKNLLIGFFGQLLILILGIVLPRFVLVSFGSEVNGLLSTVTQVYTYLALLQAGIGNASINLLYKYLSCDDKKNILYVVSATKLYFRKLSKIYLGLIFFVAVLFPILTTSNIERNTIFAIIILQGLPSFIYFYFVSAYEQLLIAEGENYILSSLNVILRILTTSIKIILIYLGSNIIIVQLAFCIVSCLKSVFLFFYIKSKYKWLKLDLKNADISILTERKAFLTHEVSNTIFNSTDLITLSIFCGMTVASVYSVYNLVFSAISILISTINNSIYYILGQTFHKNNSLYICVHDTYEIFYLALIFSFFSSAYILITPFILLYTKGVVDVNYVNLYLPILFTIVQLLSCSRAISAKLIAISGHARNTQKNTIIEAVINLTVSIILVNLIGIYGVLIGTIIALLYRSNDIIIYANKKILRRSPKKIYLVLLVNYLVFLFIVIISQNITLSILNYAQFVKYGFIISIFVFFLYFFINIIINIKQIKLMMIKINIIKK